MSLSDPRIIYGVHSVSPYNRTTGAFYGTAKVLDSSNFSMAGELNELFGGASRFAWAVEDATISAELQLKMKQVESWMIEIFLGKAPTDVTSASTSGAVSTLTSKVAGVFSATVGIASVSALAGSEADMKFGKYLVKYVSATTVDVYASSDVDFNRGTDKEFVDDLLKITSSALTIATGANVTIPGFGLKLTGGSGTIALVAGGSATFEVHPPYTKTMEVTIGGTADTFPEFGCIMVAQQRANGEMFEIDAYRCKGAGLPIGFTSKEYGQPEVTAKAFYDSAKNAIAKIRWVLPS